MHSWRTLILPYLGQQALYDKIDLTKPWDDPANREAFHMAVRQYRCPLSDGPANHTTYLAIVAPDGCFRATEPQQLSDLKDDPALTLMVVEVGQAHAVHWMSPMDASEALLLGSDRFAADTHRDRINAVSLGGALQFRATQLRALISINGRDDGTAARAVVVNSYQ